MDMAKSAGILFALGLAALPGCSQTPAAPALAQAPSHQCFLARDVNGYGVVSDELVDVSVGASRYFRLQLSGGCPRIDWTRRLALKTTAGTSWICEGLDAEIFSLDAPVPQRCLVENVTPISKEQWLATRHR